MPRDRLQSYVFDKTDVCCQPTSFILMSGLTYPECRAELAL